jgi:hypothetical protein
MRRSFSAGTKLNPLPPLYCYRHRDKSPAALLAIMLKGALLQVLVHACAALLV